MYAFPYHVNSIENLNKLNYIVLTNLLKIVLNFIKNIKLLVSFLILSNIHNLI